MKKSFKTIFFLFFTLLSLGSYGEIINPTEKEDISIKCECIMMVEACHYEAFANLSGKPIQTWYQPGHLEPGVLADLNAACYRKREMGGEGLCCTTNDKAKTIRNLFRGTKQ